MESIFPLLYANVYKIVKREMKKGFLKELLKNSDMKNKEEWIRSEEGTEGKCQCPAAGGGREESEGKTLVSEQRTRCSLTKDETS